MYNMDTPATYNKAEWAALGNPQNEPFLSKPAKLVTLFIVPLLELD